LAIASVLALLAGLMGLSLFLPGGAGMVR